MSRVLPPVDPTRIPPPADQCQNPRDIERRQVIDYLVSVGNKGAYPAVIARHIGKDTEATKTLLQAMIAPGLVSYQTGVGWRLRKGVE